MNWTPPRPPTTRIHYDGKSHEAVTQVAPSHERPRAGERGRELASGARLGRFVIEGLRFEGGFAAIYRATEVASGRAVAIKVLHAHLTGVPQALERLRREAETVNRLRHPNIVEMIDCGEIGGTRPYIVMEWLDGHDLEAELRARGPMSAPQALEVMVALCGALAAAHAQGVVHRDLKAQNVVALARGDGLTVKLVDFGVAKLLEAGPDVPQLTDRHQVLGTPLNMAPEQILGKRVDRRTDVYALGLLLFQLLTGRLPFVGASAAETVHLHLHATPPRASELASVPVTVDAVIARCLEKQPERRFPDVQALVLDLRAAVRGAAVA